MLNHDTIIDAQNSASHWSSASEPSLRDRHERWSEMLHTTHLPWAIGKALDEDFQAELSFRSFGGYRLAQCSCSRVDGFRSMSEVAGTDKAYLTLLYLQEGREQLTAEGREISLNAGDLILWDSTQKMRFRVPENISKVSLLIPEETLISHFPQAHNYIGAIIRQDAGMGAILGAHIRALGLQINELSDAQLSSVMDVTLDLLATTLRSEYGIDRSVQQATLSRIREYVVSRLGDPDLSPAGIAQVFGISIRHLYSLFEKQESSVAAWIKEQRMDRARHDLMQAGLSGKSVTEIALDWGYQDLSHFSKTFKQAFGLAPREFLRQYR